MSYIKDKYLYPGLLLVFLVAVFILGSVYYHSDAGSFTRFVMPSLVNDDLYYYARTSDVLRGNYSIGNPFFYEHRSDVAPAFFLPDIIYALPAIAFGSINYSIFFNFIFWSLLFYFFTYKILKSLDLPPYLRFLFAGLISYFFFALIFRPVSTQFSLTVYVAFLLIFLSWVKYSPGRHGNIFLGTSVVVAVYLYQYLAQVVLATMFVAVLYYYLVAKDLPRVKALLRVGACVFVALLPFFYTSFNQLDTPFYWESVERIGLVNSRLPVPMSIFYSLLIVVFMIVLGRLNKDKRLGEAMGGNSAFAYITGTGLFAALHSNLITGKDLELASHVGGLFTAYWLLVCAFVLGSLFYCLRDKLRHGLAVPLAVFLVALGLFAATDLRLKALNSFDVVVYGEDELTNLKQVQRYMALKEWVADNGGPDTVVVAGSQTSTYLSSIGGAYFLFNSFGGLQLVSDDEVLERYLVQGYFHNLTREQLRSEFRGYLGAGAIHRFNDYNKKVKLCSLFGFGEGVCGEKVTTVQDFVGGAYFDAAYGRYLNEIKPNITGLLDKYGVRYIIADKMENEIVSIPELYKEVYQDDSFIVYGK